MRMSKKKKMFRWFTMVDFEEEEVFLRQQHKMGWKFRKFILPGFYIFEECEPEDVVYRLDYSTVAKEDKEGYLQIFRDCNWEYLFDVNGWSYFRKPAEEEEQKNDIFSDVETKIAFLNRIRWSMMPLLIIFFFCILPQIALNYNNIKLERERRVLLGEMYAGSSQILASQIFLGIFLVLFFMYLGIFLKYGFGIRALKKKYLKGER